MRNPSINIKWESSLTESDYNSGAPIVRLNGLVFKAAGLKSGDWVKISSTFEDKAQRKTIFRIVRGGGKEFSNLSEDCVMIDATGAFQLGVDSLRDEQGRRFHREEPIVRANEQIPVYSANWEISKATFLGCIQANWQHPDRGYRVSLQISLVSLVVGFMGLIAGIVGIVT